MSTLDDNSTHNDHESGHGGHGHWMMVACCIPMLVIAIVLVSTGVAGASVIFAAIMCTLMMVMMMRAM
jgi:Flp pilus assembly protein TadB